MERYKIFHRHEETSMRRLYGTIMAKLRSYEELLEAICQNKLLCEDCLHDSSASGDARIVSSDSKCQQASKEVEMSKTSR
mmetsp:Transcript_2338/g.5495  ORF Transcript_2338/g.5495 Transcript_2338/m.5495 type:complete len:80 (-) Transcript_2338:129-368(-)